MLRTRLTDVLGVERSNLYRKMRSFGIASHHHSSFDGFDPLHSSALGLAFPSPNHYQRRKGQSKNRSVEARLPDH